MMQRTLAEPQVRQVRAGLGTLGEVTEELNRMISQLGAWRPAPEDGSSWLTRECVIRNLENAAVALRQLTFDTRVVNGPRGGSGAGA
jgi:hypothetical protein